MNIFRDEIWTESKQNLDFIFERDGRAFGVEVKNTLRYIRSGEFRDKLRMCRTLGLTPIFVCRMLPKPWIREVNLAGGCALLLKWQLFPRSERRLVERLRSELGLPVDTPRRLQDGTLDRLEKALAYVNRK